MKRTSQSGHFNLHWVEAPTEWLTSLETTAPLDPLEHWKWIASHHQLLTLAKRSERETGLSVLWFQLQAQAQAQNSAVSAILFGAVLPDDRIALIPSKAATSLKVETTFDAESIKEFLRAKIKFKRIMGAKSDLDGLALRSVVIERQLAWGKPLSTADAKTEDTLLSLKTECRRATEVDRARVQRWARLFAIDTKTSPEATTLEAFEWLRRGRLMIFEDDGPVGMAALSGDYDCPRRGRIGRLSLIFIDPNHRGRGHGHAFLRSIEEEMRLEKMKGIVLYSDHRNEKIQNFYSSLGFKVFDEWLEIQA